MSHGAISYEILLRLDSYLPHIIWRPRCQNCELWETRRVNTYGIIYKIEPKMTKFTGLVSVHIHMICGKYESNRSNISWYIAPCDTLSPITALMVKNLIFCWGVWFLWLNERDLVFVRNGGHDPLMEFLRSKFTSLEKKNSIT